MPADEFPRVGVDMAVYRALRHGHREPKHKPTEREFQWWEWILVAAVLCVPGWISYEVSVGTFFVYLFYGMSIMLGILIASGMTYSIFWHKKIKQVQRRSTGWDQYDDAVAWRRLENHGK